MKRTGMPGRGKNGIILTCTCANRLRSVRLNIGAKLLKAKLAIVLSRLFSSLDTRICNAREHSAESGEIRQRTINSQRRLEMVISFLVKIRLEKKIFVIARERERAKRSRCLASAEQEAQRPTN